MCDMGVVLKLRDFRHWIHRMLAVPFRSIDRASLSRERKKQNQLGKTWRDWSEQTSREEPAQNGARRPCFRIALNPTDIQRQLAIY